MYTHITYVYPEYLICGIFWMHICNLCIYIYICKFSWQSLLVNSFRPMKTLPIFQVSKAFPCEAFSDTLVDL